MLNFTVVKQFDFDGYWDVLIAAGKYSISTSQIIKDSGATAESTRQAVSTAKRKGKLFSAAKGLYILIPPSYRSWRVVPADHFIDSMMNYLGCSYYVGFLTASSYWGASHQATQEFQVVVDRHVRNRDIERVRLRFHQSKNLESRDTQSYLGSTSMFTIASVDQCVVDLVAHPSWGGSISNVATVLAELQPLDGSRIAHLASLRSQSIIRRVGWLLEYVGADVDLEPLKQKTQNNSSQVLLDPARRREGIYDPNWGVIINTKVEVDI